MSKVYRVGPGKRLINAIYRWLVARGKGSRYVNDVAVRGRKSGIERSIPLSVMDVDGSRYLVAPYGEVNWVLNLRAAKEATLRRGSEVRAYSAEELDPRDAVGVIREYVRRVPVTKDYWNVNAASSDDEVERDARDHPVFRLTAA